MDFEQFKEFLNSSIRILSQTLKISPTNSRWGTKSINQNKDGEYVQFEDNVEFKISLC